ncbi:response regulator [Leptolyngbya sp. PCC 6406]|uniref:response regulator n=1 Tax=Leptolyngbya sp. PCC 6406 TaxID=1173264 RepID=UPI0002AC4F40|nr:response regulator [Leptolyngbya sp. PCC 6406]
MSKPVILCVDDEPIVLESLRAQLREAFGDAYYYEVAQDADDALEVLDEIQAENTDVIVIVSDWLMPGMKGDEFLIKVHQRFPKVVKVLLTGQADETAIARVKVEANLHKCLFKPWSEADLIEAIQSGLASHG